jgi:hypothetical protein
MAFSRSSRAPKPVRPHVTVFPVGGRVYVMCAGNESARATLTDDTGTQLLATLADGTEMMILGWRPGWSGTARYRVRSTETGLEGWLRVGNLRGTEAPTFPAPAVATPPAVSSPQRSGEQVGDSTRPFGLRNA